MQKHEEVTPEDVSLLKQEDLYREVGRGQLEAERKYRFAYRKCVG
jgi:hypothetical protein